jgi:hypothetical protein
LRTLCFSLLVTLCLPAAAQNWGARGSSRPAPSRGQGNFGPPVSPVPFFGLNYPYSFANALYKAQNPLWGAISPSAPFGVASTGAYPAGSAAAPYYGVGFGGVHPQAYYPPPFYPPVPLAQPAPNITVIAGPPAAPLPAPIAMAVPAPADAPAADSRPAAATREPVAPAAYPALVAVKDGNFYSVNRYWVKGRTLHFVTTNGESMEVPLSSVERLYPAEKAGN